MQKTLPGKEKGEQQLIENRKVETPIKLLQEDQWVGERFSSPAVVTKNAGSQKGTGKKRGRKMNRERLLTVKVGDSADIMEEWQKGGVNEK